MTLVWLVAWLIAGTPRVDWFNDGWNGWGIALLGLIACDLFGSGGSAGRK